MFVIPITQKYYETEKVKKTFGYRLRVIKRWIKTLVRKVAKGTK